ncbi:hypothetical protein A0H81_10039 [Grifola frondosa]|uniref:PUB domain-containing protein n=1 Tax=Grifola frondosa TaxID=5627 RepID=A0A1C7M1G0_GRIFR|nr:hypothetical protein A0H81_10039 [Grifola frondosa]
MDAEEPISGPSPDHSAVAAAVERRIRQEQLESPVPHHADFDANHEKRQEFRRMIDPGILRPNPRNVALESLQTLLKLADNILEHPDDTKYQKFKPTNANIKRRLVDPRGTLEYAVALGFHPEVVDFQPFYVFHKRHMSDLRIGAAIIKEALERELPKDEQQLQAKLAEKAAHAAAVAKVKQAFYDDRKSRAMIDQRERQVRAAAAARTSASPPAPASPRYTVSPMPGSGHTLRDDAEAAEDFQDE